jgi:MFS family permease
VLNTRIRHLAQQYPRQFWLLFWGMLISTLGASMIWPFLMIYVSEQLELPLVTVTSLMTIQATMGLISSFIAGPVTDRVGRKWVMVLSLSVNGMGYLFLSQAHSLPAFAVLMGLNGAFNPLYRVAADAMMADLVPPEKRIDAYSLLRTSNNMGVALGPAIGGLIAAISYNIAFYIAAAGLITFSLLIAFFARETLPDRSHSAPPRREKFGGYGRILKDRPFMSFAFTMVLTQMCAVMIFLLLGVYAKQNFQIKESLYGLIPTTNALMVVLFQMSVTRVTKRYPPLFVLATGSLFYAIGVGSVALGHGFWGFWLSMVILTVGELIIAPTASTYTANSAPPDMRGRYMSIFALTWGAAAGIGPLLGGYLNDNLGPVYIWLGGLVIGIISTSLFLLLARRNSRIAQAPG